MSHESASMESQIPLSSEETVRVEDGKEHGLRRSLRSRKPPASKYLSWELEGSKPAKTKTVKKGAAKKACVKKPTEIRWNASSKKEAGATTSSHGESGSYVSTRQGNVCTEDPALCAIGPPGVDTSAGTSDPEVGPRKTLSYPVSLHGESNGCATKRSPARHRAFKTATICKDTPGPTMRLGGRRGKRARATMQKSYTSPGKRVSLTSREQQMAMSHDFQRREDEGDESGVTEEFAALVMLATAVLDQYPTEDDHQLGATGALLFAHQKSHNFVPSTCRVPGARMEVSVRLTTLASESEASQDKEPETDGPDTDDDHYHHIDSGNKAHVAAREGGVDGVTSSASI